MAKTCHCPQATTAIIRWLPPIPAILIPLMSTFDYPALRHPDLVEGPLIPSQPERPWERAGSPLDIHRNRSLP
jgi:hypothetical protein